MFEFIIRKVVISLKFIYYDEDLGYEDDDDDMEDDKKDNKEDNMEDDEYDFDYYIFGWMCNYLNEICVSFVLKDFKFFFDDD